MPATRPALSYRLLSFLLLIIWVIHAAWMALKNKQIDFLWQRLGVFPASQNKADIWIHASSVGEIELIKPLVEQLQKGQSILVTTFTITGYQHALRIMPDTVSVRAIPIDLLPISFHFIQYFNFKLALIAETELWPETLYQTKKKGIPLIQINARLSDKSLRTSGWSRALLKNTLLYFDEYLTRTGQDVEKLLSMGIDKTKISITGNLKYAHSPSNSQYEQVVSQPYILFASTHFPEEKLFAELISQINAHPLFVIVPRHPQRAKQIVSDLKSLGLNLKQRSLNETITEQTQVYLADTLGELKALMVHAELVIMGGSFDSTGGHNVLEPARLGKAIITGPSDDNIQQDIELLAKHDAIVQLDGADQLTNKINELLDNPVVLENLSRNAAQVMHTQSHILDDYLTVINRYL